MYSKFLLFDFWWKFRCVLIQAQALHLTISKFCIKLKCIRTYRGFLSDFEKIKIIRFCIIFKLFIRQCILLFAQNNSSTGLWARHMSILLASDKIQSRSYTEKIGKFSHLACLKLVSSQTGMKLKILIFACCSPTKMEYLLKFSWILEIKNFWILFTFLVK